MKFSVITINFNNAAGLEKTILSVINQDCDDFEYIVIDGGSTDGSVEIIKKHSDRIAYWVSEKDNGVYHAMNKGVAQAKGDYCIFMNSGDCFHSSGVLSLMSVYEEDFVIGKVIKGDASVPCGHNKSDITLIDLMRGSLPHQAMFIRRELLFKHPYDQRYKIVSDWKFCIEALVLDNCTFKNVDTIVADYDTSGISSNSGNLLPIEKKEILIEIIPPRILNDYLRLAPADDELLDQSLRLTHTVTARKVVKRLSNMILQFTKQRK